MRKITIVLILIFLMNGNVLISGCVDKESAITEIPSSQSSALSSERDFRDAIEIEAEQELYERIKRYPIMESVDVEINNPNIELAGVYVNDFRKYEGDLSCAFYIVVQNTGKGDVWIGKDLAGIYKNTGLEANYEFYKSGDMKIYIIQGPNTEDVTVRNTFYESKYLPHVSIDSLLNGDTTIKVNAYDTIAPKVSSGVGFILGYSTFQDEFFELESVTYRVDEKNWEYIVAKVNNPTSNELSGHIYLTVHEPQSGWGVAGENTRAFTISPRGSETLEMNLWGTPPGNLRRIDLITD